MKLTKSKFNKTTYLSKKTTYLSKKVQLPKLSVSKKRKQFIPKKIKVMKKKLGFVLQMGFKENIFKIPEDKIILSEEEMRTFGNRCPSNYTKQSILGKGGFAIVWKGKNQETDQIVAMKQISQKHSHGTHKRELRIAKKWFLKGGAHREEVKNHPGISNIAALVDNYSTRSDQWLMFEMGGQSLSKMLFDVKGEFYKGERIYCARKQELYFVLKENPSVMKAFITKMLHTLDFLQSQQVVHCDLKPDNILITADGNNRLNLKLVDFGSAIEYAQPSNFGMITPEYMPPEVLKLSESMVGDGSYTKSEILAGETHPWSVDIWSLGCILTEMVIGVPLWLSLKCKNEIGKKTVIQNGGLFAVKGKRADKIIMKQKDFIRYMVDILGPYLDYWPQGELLGELIYLMMQWNPKDRSSPEKLLTHKFITGNYNKLQNDLAIFCLFNYLFKRKFKNVILF